MSNIEVNNQTGAEKEKNHMAEHMTKEQVDALWAETEKNSFIEALKNAGERIDEEMEKIDGFSEAYLHELDELTCSDERVYGGGRKLGVAGQGILLSAENLEILKDFCRRNVKTVTSHYDCGAAGKAFAEMKKRGEALPEGVTTADELGRHHSEMLAEEIPAEPKFIPKEDLRCEIHHGRGTIIDGTGRFDIDALKGIPAFFTEHAAGIGLSSGYVKEEAGLLSGIDLESDHGFNERFTSESPFYVIISAKDEEQLSELTALAKEAVEKFGDRIQVKGFVAPLEK